jgi:hypothetical protein
VALLPHTSGRGEAARQFVDDILQQLTANPRVLVTFVTTEHFNRKP